jgi:hypothetical protein
MVSSSDPIDSDSSMNILVFSAAILTFLLGAVHSFLGEKLIFNRMRTKGIVPTEGHELLKAYQVRIIWASWHLVTVFGWGIGAIFLFYSLPLDVAFEEIVIDISFYSVCLGALLVFCATKGKHLGWAVLLVIGLLLLLRRLVY